MATMQKIGSTATHVYVNNGQTQVFYHSTAVVQFTDETIKLNTGGWFTATTKARMNQASNQFNLGYSVFADKGVWYARTPSGDHQFDGDQCCLDRQADFN